MIQVDALPGEGESVLICEACGSECPEGAAYCGACGHHLGDAPEEPLIVEVRGRATPSCGCLDCLTTVVVVLVLVFLALWLFSC